MSVEYRESTVTGVKGRRGDHYVRNGGPGISGLTLHITVNWYVEGSGPSKVCLNSLPNQ